uniref:Uncharacterized protein n=1 Tax=Lactuca sativa TaxID=4236 RepID=A0A9R1WF30_LACSA|nr:hypothetical protein LSAT_V11C200057650 [Lactuca sativa]
MLQRFIASDIKECVCRAPDTPYDGWCSFFHISVYYFLVCKLQSQGRNGYEFLPNIGGIRFYAFGNQLCHRMEFGIPVLSVEIGSDRFKTPDVLFNPSLIKTIPGMEGSIDISSSARGLPLATVWGLFQFWHLTG